MALLTGGASGTISLGILSGILTGTGAAFVASLLPIAVAVLQGLVE
ncbi:MAG: hypothetical protein KDA79_24515 [Planctomycetaceae bacterium]|nr:hypothetical protein [Planctomycetaceae bacterium]